MAYWKRIAPLLDAALNKLVESDRVAILLRYFEKKTAKEIGGALQLSEEAAQKRVARALDRLRRLLVGEGATLSSATLATLIATQSVVAVPLVFPLPSQPPFWREALWPDPNPVC